MTWRRALPVVLLVGIAAGCSREASVDRGADTSDTDAGVPSVWIELHRDRPDLLRLKWRIRNASPGPIWVPVAWPATRGLRAQPIPFLIPGGEIVFVFADFQPGDDRAPQTITEWADIGAQFRRIESGKTMEGEVLLQLPYDVRNVPLELGNPFVATKTEESLFVVKEVTYRLASGVYVAAEYWVSDPVGPDRAAKADTDHELVREAMAYALITGSSQPDVSARENRLVTSRRVAARIPLKEPITLCESIGGPWEETETDP